MAAPSTTRRGVLAACLLLLASLSLSCAAEYRFTGRSSTPGQDFDCGQKDGKGNPQPFCRLCGGLATLADACDANERCKGFDLEGSYCGYPKAGTSQQQYMEGFSNFCKVGPSSSCKGSYSIKRRSSITGADVDCNAKNYKGEHLPYCDVSGEPVTVAAACDANPSCKAFVMQGSSSGRLKTASSPTTYTEESTAFVKA